MSSIIVLTHDLLGSVETDAFFSVYLDYNLGKGKFTEIYWKMFKVFIKNLENTKFKQNGHNI